MADVVAMIFQIVAVALLGDFHDFCCAGDEGGSSESLDMEAYVRKITSLFNTDL